MKKLTYEYVSDYVINNSNCELISKDYKGVDFNLEFKCECGEIFKRNFYNFRKYEKRCLKCRDKKAMQKKLEETQIRDKIKDKYCKENNIKLIRIPYFEFDNIDEILKCLL